MLIPSAAVGVAATVAVSVAAVGPGRSASPGAKPKIETVAYVLSRARSALGAAGDDILEIQSSVSNGISYTTWVDQSTWQYRVDIRTP